MTSVLLTLAAGCAKSHRKQVVPVEPAPTMPVEPIDAAPPEPEPEPEPLDATPNDATPVEPEPDALQLIACEEGPPETTCATLTEGGVSLVGVDSGRYCQVPILGGLAINKPSGFPVSLTWEGDQIYGCFEDSGKLQRISLREQNAQGSERACMSVLSWQGGLLVQENFLELTAYASFDDAASDQHAKELPFTPLALLASHGQLLYGHIDGMRIDDKPVRPLQTITLGATHGQTIELEGLPNLLSQEAYVTGLDLTHDGRIVVLRTGDRHGVTVYDGATHAELAHYEAPRTWIAAGLVCRE